MGGSGGGCGQSALSEDVTAPDFGTERVAPDSELDEIEVGWWPTFEKTPNRLTFAGLFVLGVLAGIVLTIVCIFVMIWVLWPVALLVGPIVALVIWLLFAAFNVRSEERNPTRLWFLAGFGVITCFFGIWTTLSLIGWMLD
ncbi:hypothetical protein HLB23_34385 [Nocardia uniformis]|uniref:Uncharacterized protein n=1 Tax=Nocardia uniformis TaxID=53432 RepID=A0A849CJR4_9NOCA|nr:hypothetical protein [Nocardia uniformis]NNH74881.1 hypothetical protein [Nocardia uniformis]